MAIEGIIVPELTYEQGRFGYVSNRLWYLWPGRHTNLLSFPETGEELIAVKCHLGNKGGEVYTFYDFPPEWLVAGIPPNEFKDEYLKRCIWPDEKYERRIFDVSGKASMLLLRHVSLADIANKEL